MEIRLTKQDYMYVCKLTWWSHHRLVIPPRTFLITDMNTVFQTLYSCAGCHFVCAHFCSHMQWEHDEVLNNAHILKKKRTETWNFALEQKCCKVVVNQQIKDYKQVACMCVLDLTCTCMCVCALSLVHNNITCVYLTLHVHVCVCVP